MRACIKISIMLIIAMSLMLSSAFAKSYEEIKALFDNQQYDEVIKETTRVLSKDKGGDKTAELYYLRGLSYDLLGKIDWAIEDYNKAVNIYPGFGEAYVALGQLLIETNELNAAENAFNSALELIEEEPISLTSMGYIRLVQNRVKEARDFLSRAIATKDAPSQAYANLGYIEYTEGNLDDAQDYLETAITKNPEDYTAMFTLGLVYMLKNDFMQASDCLKKVVENNPEDLEAHLAIAKSYEQLGLKEAAINHLNEALKLSPNNNNISNWLNRLKEE